MPKGKTVGNFFIDGTVDGKGGAPETATRKRENKSSREAVARKHKKSTKEQ